MALYESRLAERLLWEEIAQLKKKYDPTGTKAEAGELPVGYTKEAEAALNADPMSRITPEILRASIENYLETLNFMKQARQNRLPPLLPQQLRNIAESVDSFYFDSLHLNFGGAPAHPGKAEMDPFEATAYLEALRQCCIRQIPTDGGRDPNAIPGDAELDPRHKLAGQQFQEAQQANPDATTNRQFYNWLTIHDDSPNDLPTFDSWERYLRGWKKYVAEQAKRHKPTD